MIAVDVAHILYDLPRREWGFEIDVRYTFHPVFSDGMVVDALHVVLLLRVLHDGLMLPLALKCSLFVRLRFRQKRAVKSNARMAFAKAIALTAAPARSAVICIPALLGSVQ